MSDEGDHEAESPTTFTCHYGGAVDKLNGEVIYVGGDVRFIETNSCDLFTALINQLSVSLYGQKVSYKLPFDGIEDRKVLTNGDGNFEKMCKAALWVKAIDIFVEPDIEKDRMESGGWQFEEETRVESLVVDFVDEEGGEHPYETPENSDGEGEGRSYVRYEKGSGEFKLGQVFDTLKDFQQAVIDYTLKYQWNVHYVRWENDKSEVKCAWIPDDGNEKCLWKIYCSYEAPLQKWMVKTYRKIHSCVKTRFSKILNEHVIAKLFLNDLRDDPQIKPKTIQGEIEKMWNLVATIDQCRNAKRRALGIIQQEHDEQFSRLKDYRLELLRSNAESTVELETFPGADGVDIFFRFYVCFASLRETWSAYCRPIFGLDGCFLKCTTKGQLLAAVGRDSNNQMYPIAWAVVDVENEDNWMWFIHKLQTDLQLGDGTGFAVISDRQKGLLNAVSHFLPKVEHRMCARHIYAKLKMNHPDRADMKKLFWKVAKSFNKPQYTYRMDKVKKYDMKVYDSMMLKNPKNCSLAYFKETFCCIDVSNNISEAFNHAINPARQLPMVEMLETIRRQAMLRIEARRKKSVTHRGTFTPNSVKLVDAEKKKIINCKAFPSGVGKFEVKEKNCAFMVDMEKHTCACRKWEMSGLPCRHALKVIEDKKLNEEHFISDWYLTSKWRNIYSANILPVLGINFWGKTEDTLISPPQQQVTQGRKRVPKRIKEKNESPKKKKKKNDTHESPTKISREKRIVHCGRCGWIGHNATKCQNVVIKEFRKPRKKKTTGNVSELGEGSSQPSQSQVID